MTREQFLALAGQLFDAQAGGVPVGSGKPPRFDTVLPRGGGMVSYASECSEKELRYHLGRAEQPPTDPKWKDANEKKAKALRFWLSYRIANPVELWRGERNRVTVTAAMPSDKPAQYDKDAPTPSAAEAAFTDPPDEDPDGDIPFIFNVTSEPTERWHRF